MKGHHILYILYFGGSGQDSKLESLHGDFLVLQDHSIILKTAVGRGGSLLKTAVDRGSSLLKTAVERGGSLLKTAVGRGGSLLKNQIWADVVLS